MLTPFKNHGVLLKFCETVVEDNQDDSKKDEVTVQYQHQRKWFSVSELKSLAFGQLHYLLLTSKEI